MVSVPSLFWNTTVLRLFSLDLRRFTCPFCCAIEASINMGRDETSTSISFNSEMFFSSGALLFSCSNVADSIVLSSRIGSIIIGSTISGSAIPVDTFEELISSAIADVGKQAIIKTMLRRKLIVLSLSAFGFI